MPAERRQRLEALPGWIWDVSHAQWEDGFAALEQYVEEHTHARVIGTYKTADGYALGSWVATQRATKDTMPAERRQRLEALPGWVWKVKS